MRDAGSRLRAGVQRRGYFLPSPCVLPLVPVYLSVTTGLGVAELSQRGPGRAATAARGAGLFILGFGLVVIIMALAMLAGTTARGLWVARERRFHPDPVRHRPWAAPVTGAAFAFGWTPCIVPWSDRFSRSLLPRAASCAGARCSGRTRPVSRRPFC